MNTKLKHALPMIVWMEIILSFTLQPATASSQLSGSITLALFKIIEFLNIPISLGDFHFLVRKLAHVSEYMILGLLIFYACKAYSIRFRNKIVIVLVVGFAFASLDEYLQTFVVGRSGQIMDVLIDGIGIVLSIGIVLYLRLLRQRKEQTQLTQ